MASRGEPRRGQHPSRAGTAGQGARQERHARRDVTLEREVKLGVWPGFSLPDLADVAEGVTVEQATDQRLEATYHDTADLRLARWGITLRYRTGEASPRTKGSSEDGWTLKLPKSSSV